MTSFTRNFLSAHQIRHFSTRETLRASYDRRNRLLEIGPRLLLSVSPLQELGYTHVHKELGVTRIGQLSHVTKMPLDVDFINVASHLVVT
jgi:hypothetical protein